MLITEQNGFGIQPPTLDELQLRLASEAQSSVVAAVIQEGIDERVTYLAAQRLLVNYVSLPVVQAVSDRPVDTVVQDVATDLNTGECVVASALYNLHDRSVLQIDDNNSVNLGAGIVQI